MKGRASDLTRLQGGPAPPVVGRARRESDQEGAPAARRWGQCQDPKSTRPTAVPGSGLPLPDPASGPRGVSGDVTGGDYSLVRAVVRPPLTGRAGVGGVAAASGETAQRCAVSSAARAPRAHASPPSASPAAKFGSTLRPALTPCPFHLPLQVLGGRGEPGSGPSAAPGPPARRRRRAATATAARGRGAPAWGRRPAPASGRRRGPRGRPAPGARPPGSPRGPPDLGRLNRNCSPIDSTGPGERPGACARARAEGRRAGSRSLAARVAAPRRGRSLPYLCVCRRLPSSPEDFRERLGAAFPACEAREGLDV